jgi:hypothetical protein
MLEYPDRPATPARVGVRHHRPRERTLGALRMLATCWSLAVAAVLVPVLHFILVPGLLLLGPALAWSRLQEDRTLVYVEGACPACGRVSRDKLMKPWRERTLLRCDGCHRQVALVLEAGRAGPAGERPHGSVPGTP